MGHRLENGMENGNGNLGKWNLRISSLFLRVEGMGSTEVHPYAELLGNESHGPAAAGDCSDIRIHPEQGPCGFLVLFISLHKAWGSGKWGPGTGLGGKE